MSAMQSEVFEALRSLDIPEEKAVKAAAALSRRDDDVAALKGDLLLIKWMIASLFALFAAINGPIAWIVLRMAIKIGALS